MSKHKYTREQKMTRKVIESMLKENTGRHFLDSGGAYGRHWERNQKIASMDDTPAAELEIAARHGNGEIMVTLSLYHFLADRLTFDAKIQKQFDAFAALPEQKDNSWADSMNDFVKSVGGTSRYAFYTYNDDNMLSQDFIASAWNDSDDNAMVFVQSHNGCDARGGFSSPKVFQFDHECELYDYDRATIACDNGHWWDYEGGYNARWYSDDNPNLETFEIVESSADVNPGDLAQVPEPHILAAAYREYRALLDSIRLPGLNDVKPTLPVGGKIVIDGDVYHCPLCGSKLQAYQAIAD